MSATSSPTQTHPLARWIPALGWLRRYDKTWLRGDIVAGVTLAAYLLPAGLGDASLIESRAAASGRSRSCVAGHKGCKTCLSDGHRGPGAQHNAWNNRKRFGQPGQRADT